MGHEEIPDTAMVPLKFAHMVIGKSRSTVYQWYQDERFTTQDQGAGPLVNVGELREVERRMVKKRLRRKA